MRKKRSPARTPRRSSQRKSAAQRPEAPSLLQAVSHNTLFTGVSPEILHHLVPKLLERRYRKGEIIFDESTSGRNFYLIISGRVRIKKYAKHGIESLLALLHEGDFFGELSIIDGLPRSARAEAVETCRIAVCSAADFRSFIKESDAFTFNLLKKLAIRLRTIDHAFVRELEKNAVDSLKKLERMHKVVEASKIVNSTIETEKLLGLILETATRGINADRGTVYLLDEQSRTLWSKVSQGRNMVEIRLPVGKGLAGYVAQTGETINIADAYSDPRFNPEIDKRSGYKTRTVLCMPMRDKSGKIVGVFQLLNKNRAAFRAEDEAFIEALSLHAAIAIENARMAQQLVRTERLSTVGRMASTIIHDIKNPMATLRMYAQVIKKKSGDQEAVEMADEMMRQVDRFVNMTQEILDYARGSTELRIESIDLGTLMEDALHLIELDLRRKNIELRRNFTYVGPCKLDADKMIRVFYNLASNAADAMPRGGSLTVTTTKHRRQLRIDFCDSGTGMSEEVRQRAFEPFFSRGKKHGTGLGLAIIKKIVEDHRGSIAIESVVNKGTTVRLTLPLS